MNSRRYYVDWLRVFAMLGVFLFHCSRFFDNEDWNLKAPLSQQTGALSILRGIFIWAWLMELFFLLAGFGTWYAIHKRTGGQYLAERAKRLLIPLYTVGLFILLVPQVYFDRLTHGQVTSTFWQWLPGYIAGLPGEIFRRPNFLNPLFLVPFNSSGHLWFVQVLFLISLLFLPVVLYLKSEQGQRLIAALAGWVEKPAGILLFAIPLAVGRVALYWLPITSDQTWGEFVWYGLFFVFGFIIAADERFSNAIKKQGWICLAVWLGLQVGIGGLFTFVLNFNTNTGQGTPFLYVIWQITYAFASWGSVAFILSLGAKYLDFTNDYLGYCTEAVLPFYIFHQTIIMIVGWFVLPWQMIGIAKFLIIAAISFPVIMILYEVLVRRNNFMRFLFGMAPRKKPRAAVPQVAPLTR